MSRPQKPIPNILPQDLLRESAHDFCKDAPDGFIPYIDDLLDFAYYPQSAKMKGGAFLHMYSKWPDLTLDLVRHIRDRAAKLTIQSACQTFLLSTESIEVSGKTIQIKDASHREIADAVAEAFPDLKKKVAEDDVATAKSLLRKKSYLAPVGFPQTGDGETQS